MINAKNELQYRIALGILLQMRSAGFLTEEEWNATRYLAAEKYRPITVREL
jgi:hypothetical protein